MYTATPYNLTRHHHWRAIAFEMDVKMNDSACFFEISVLKRDRKECPKRMPKMCICDVDIIVFIFIFEWSIGTQNVIFCWLKSRKPLKCLFRMLFFVLENWTHKFTYFNTTESYVMVLVFFTLLLLLFLLLHQISLFIFFIFQILFPIRFLSHSYLAF